MRPTDGRQRVNRAEERLDLVQGRERQQGHLRRAWNESTQRSFQHVDRDLGRGRHHDLDDGRSLQVAGTQRLLHQAETSEDDLPGLQSTSPSESGDANEELDNTSTDGDDGPDSPGERGDDPLVEVLFIDDVETAPDPSAVQERKRAGEALGERAGQSEGRGTSEKEAGGRSREGMGRAVASDYF